MISSDGCRQLVAGSYDVLINEPITCKSVLKDFLDHFRQHENELGQPDCGYVREFKMLKEFSKTLKENKVNLVDGESDLNQTKNRYKDIIPFSHTRVILSSSSELGPGSDYINANYIRGPSGSPRAYIACQGPLASTLLDFWRMIWECNVSVIIMACNEFESGKPKCELYWPAELDTSRTYGSIQVTLKRVRQINSDFLIRKFSIRLLEPIASNAKQNQQPDCSQKHDNQQQQVIYNNNDNNYQPNGNMGDLDGSNDYRCSASGCQPTRRDCNKCFSKQPGVASSFDNETSGTSAGNSSTSDESINLDSDSQQTGHKGQENNAQQSAQQNNSQQQSKDNTVGRKQRAILMERTICQFHYTTWPDHGVPPSVQPILELVRLVREVQPAEDRPILVHCSAGCGRTGTICCIDHVWGLLRRGKLDSSFDLYSIISEMREQRMAMVQTLEQYILCHRAVAALFIQHLQIMGENDDYDQDDEQEENSDPDEDKTDGDS